MKFRILFLVLASLIFNFAFTQDMAAGKNLYEEGWKFYKAKNFPEALKLFKKSRDFNVPVACRMVGWMYEYGEGVKKDFFQAEKSYLKACDLGNSPSCHGLALFYYYGYLGREDSQKAKKFFGKACDLGEKSVCSFR